LHLHSLERPSIEVHKVKRPSEGLSICSDIKAASLAAHSLAFPWRIELLATKILKAIFTMSPDGCNGLHLRLEGDAQLAGYLGTNSTQVRQLLRIRESTMTMQTCKGHGKLPDTTSDCFQDIARPQAHCHPSSSYLHWSLYPGMAIGTPTGAQSLSAFDNKPCIRPHRLDDTSDTLARICRTQAMLELYASAIEKIGIEDTLPLYVASGLLTYQGNQGVFSSMQGGAEAMKHFSSSCC